MFHCVSMCLNVFNNFILDYLKIMKTINNNLIPFKWQFILKIIKELRKINFYWKLPKDKRKFKMKVDTCFV